MSVNRGRSDERCGRSGHQPHGGPGQHSFWRNPHPVTAASSISSSGPADELNLFRAHGSNTRRGSGQSRDDLPDGREERVAVHEMAYLWEGSLVWYDQDAYPHIPVAHWPPVDPVAQGQYISPHRTRQRFEESKSGQPWRNSVDTNTYTVPTIENLYELFHRNRAKYNQKAKSALKPFRLDDGGFESTTSMLGAHMHVRPQQPQDGPPALRARTW
ncbi:hypothetical protein GQ600_19499 [Phytophthora cactorum]|nr:hypothetical protein GQ600_19499 [Phytophthora cactorum]